MSGNCYDPNGPQCPSTTIDGTQVFISDGTQFGDFINPCYDNQNNQVSCYTIPLYQDTKSTGLLSSNPANGNSTAPAWYCTSGQTQFSSYLACNKTGAMNDPVNAAFYFDSSDCCAGNTMLYLKK